MRMLWALAAGFVVTAAACGGRAVAHWRELAAFGPICGDATVHCGWCYAGAASLLAAAVCLAFAAAAGRQTLAYAEATPARRPV